MVEVEGENSAMNVVLGASMAGGRVFTATSSWGLSFMYDAVQHASGYRAPIVMVIANRESPGILAVSGGQQDIISVRDTGWIQVIVEEGQEILDMVIMAFRLAEDYDIQLPVMVNYDGFYLSYMAAAVEIPEQQDVDHFLSVLKQQPKRQTLMPGEAIGCGTHGIDLGFVELRYRQCMALEKATTKLDEIDEEFGEFFGRNYGGQIEEYRTDDAEIIILTSGGAAGTTRVVVDTKREEGIKVGLVKLRFVASISGGTADRCIRN
jgi:pyruvate/2-oxoacid:ferredoxin oxidoreductase alpha subunit